MVPPSTAVPAVVAIEPEMKTGALRTPVTMPAARVNLPTAAVPSVVHCAEIVDAVTELRVQVAATGVEATLTTVATMAVVVPEKVPPEMFQAML